MIPDPMWDDSTWIIEGINRTSFVATIEILTLELNLIKINVFIIHIEPSTRATDLQCSPVPLRSRFTTATDVARGRVSLGQPQYNLYI